MNKKSVLLFTSIVATLALAGCGANKNEESKAPSSFESYSSSFANSSAHISSSSSKNESSSNNASSSTSKASSSSSKQQESSSTKVDNRSISLRMFGKLFVNQMRTLYAIKNNTTDKLVWKSSDDKIVKTSLREGLDTECNLIALGTGEVTITVSLESDASISNSIKIKVEEGEVMPSNLYSQIVSSLRVESKVQYLNYDKDYDFEIDSEDLITTIFEEDNPDQSSYPNYTDAYEINVRDAKTNISSFHKTYVRGTGGYVSIEAIDHKNEIYAQKVFTEDYPEGIKFNNSYYVNFFDRSEYISNKDFATFDGGKTYYYVGGLLPSSYLCASLFMTDMSPDQMYFKVDNDKVTSFNIDIDPVNKDVNASVKYGLHASCDFYDVKSATINHIKPYEHKAEHDALDNAKKVFDTCKNYKVEYTLDYDNVTDQVLTYTYTNDAIDIVLKENSKIVSHEGIYKYKEGYIEYSYNDVSKDIVMTKTHDQAWDAVNRYPTFDFASELFEYKNNKYVLSEGKNNNFIKTCFYLNTIVGSSSFSNGEIVLSNEGKINNINARFTNEYGFGGKFRTTFSEYNSAKVDIDFTKLDDDDTPKSFKEANAYLYKEMGYWGLQEVVPYLYAKPGWENSIGFLRTDDKKGVEHVMISTKRFEDKTSRDAFIEAYKSLLINSGYASTPDKLINGLPSYTKGNYSFAVDCTRYYSGSEDMGVRIYIKSPTFTLDMYYASMED
mgnify:CR=1 FL=1